MNYILDTCVISELIKPEPDDKVEKWFSECDEEQLFISALTLGEIKYGINILPESRKRNDLIIWFDKMQRTFSESTLPVNDNIAIRLGEEKAICRKKGQQLAAIDGLIACTALEYNYTLATRNIKDFEIINITLFNPWL